MCNDISNKLHHITDFEQVKKKEAEHLGIDHSTHGVALSGGGIRSAAFSLGVLQQLAQQNLLKQFHYMSTVSGGGYIGSALTWWLHQGFQSTQLCTANEKRAPAGLSKDTFPFRLTDSSSSMKPEPKRILAYVRSHANYLLPTPGLDFSSVAAIALRNALLSVGVFVLVCTILAVVLPLVLLLFTIPFHYLFTYFKVLQNISGEIQWTFVVFVITTILQFYLFRTIREQIIRENTVSQSHLKWFDLVPKISVFLIALCSTFIFVDNPYGRLLGYSHFSLEAFVSPNSITHTLNFFFVFFAAFFIIASIFYSIYTLVYQALQGQKRPAMVVKQRYISRTSTQEIFGFVLRLLLFFGILYALSHLVAEAIHSAAIVIAMISLGMIGTAIVCWRATHWRSTAKYKHPDLILILGICLVLFSITLTIFQVTEWLIFFVQCNGVWLRN